MDDVCLIHHDLNKLQEILDVTNHVANKYHIQFGAAKCQVIRRGKGKKSALKLNGETLEEVPKYKYLGEIINNKGNLSDHITELEKKSQMSHRHHNSRNREQRIQGNQNASYLADGGCHNNTNNDLLMWRMGHQQRWVKQNPDHLQRGTQDHPIPSERNTNNNPPQWNWKHPHRIYNKEKTDPPSQKNRRD